jgi:hypothetical protein
MSSNTNHYARKASGGADLANKSGKPDRKMWDRKIRREKHDTEKCGTEK